MRLNETDLKLYKFTVSAVLTLPGKDASGQTSSTTTIEEGIKPKVLNCSGYIAKKNEDDLKKIFSLAEALDENGNRVIYDIVDDTASASNVRQVSFFDMVSAAEDEAFKKWKVSFTLKERNSVAEAKQKQAQEAAVAVQGTTGTSSTTASTSDSAVSTQSAAGELEVGNIEQLFVQAENWLGATFGASTEGAEGNASGT